MTMPDQIDDIREKVKRFCRTETAVDNLVQIIQSYALEQSNKAVAQAPTHQNRGDGFTHFDGDNCANPKLEPEIVINKYEGHK